MLVSYKDATHCFYCELPFSKTVIKTREHVVPRSKGGKNSPANIVAACDVCNRVKGSLFLDDFFNKMIKMKEKGDGRYSGRSIDVILKNIAILKGSINKYECLIPHISRPLKKVKSISQKNKLTNIVLNDTIILKSQDWFKECIFISEHSESMFIETALIVQKAKNRKLTHIEGIELYNRLRPQKVKPSPNFHEDAPENIKLATFS